MDQSHTLILSIVLRLRQLKMARWFVHSVQSDVLRQHRTLMQVAHYVMDSRYEEEYVMHVMYLTMILARFRSLMQVSRYSRQSQPHVRWV